MTEKFEGGNLRLARLFHGFSLQELGEKVETSKQFIQQVENGRKNPAEDLEEALSQALSVTKRYFYSPLKYQVTEDKCHFRKLRSTPKVYRWQALSHATFFSNVVEYLDESINFPEVDFERVQLEVSSPEDIEHASEVAREKWGLGLNAPIKNMIRVLEHAGAIVTEFSSVSDKIDAFSMDLKRPLIIRNKAKGSACRSRFDLAHECGHLIMHAGVETGDTRTENEAHRFASAFLLPRKVFLNEFSFMKNSARMNWSKIFNLKLRWEVSVAAIIRRAKDLEMIDALQYRGANIYLRKNGQMKNEVNDDKIEEEHPEVLSEALRVLAGSGTGIAEKMFSELGITFDFFKKIVGGEDIDGRFALVEESGNLIPYPR